MIKEKGGMNPLNLEVQMEFGKLAGMEGPFKYEQGVLYYDPAEGSYYDRRRDMYVELAPSPDPPKENYWAKVEMIDFDEVYDEGPGRCARIFESRAVRTRGQRLVIFGRKLRTTRGFGFVKAEEKPSKRYADDEDAHRAAVAWVYRGQ